MKTLQSTIEIFASEVMSQEEMNFLRGGGADQPRDIFLPPEG